GWKPVPRSDRGNEQPGQPQPLTQERVLERRHDLIEGSFSYFQIRRHAYEAVDGPVVTGGGDWYSRRAHFLRVRLAFIPQRVVLRGDYQGRCKTAQVGGIKRRRIGMAAVAVIIDVMLPEPRHRAGGKEVSLGVLTVGRRIHAPVRDRINQHLVGK